MKLGFVLRARSALFTMPELPSRFSNALLLIQKSMQEVYVHTLTRTWQAIAVAAAIGAFVATAGLAQNPPAAQPQGQQPAAAAKKVNLDTLKAEQVQSWQQGDRLLLSGKMLTGRDAAHKRIKDMLAKGEPLPVDFKGRVIYYVGPVDPVRDEVVGPAGPTTATRMDSFMDMMLDLGLLACVGKAERGPGATASIAKHKSAYLMAVGGAAYLVSRAIKASRVVGFEDLGMEAIYEFTVEDMPVTVAVDAEGQNVHQLAPLVWRDKIAKEGLLAAS